MNMQSTIATAGLCAGLLAFSSLPASAAWRLNDAHTQLTDGNYTLTVSASGQDLTITGNTAGSGNLDLTDVETNTGSRVTAIGAGAFKSKSGLKSLTAPDVVIIANGSLDNGAFYNCSGLTTATLPALTYLGDYAFQNCGSLTRIEVSADITYIGTYAFARPQNSQVKCTLKTIVPATLPKLEVIGEMAFYGNYGSDLQGDFVFPALTNLGSRAFNNTQITSFRAPALTYIGDNAFQNCGSLTFVEVSADITYIGAYAFARPQNSQVKCPLKTIVPTTLPKLEVIGEMAFYGNYGSDLQGDFVLPALTNLGSKAFTSTKITSFRAPALTYLGDNAFQCDFLTNVEVSADITYIGANAFSRTGSAQSCVLKAFLPTTLPKLEVIGTQAFYGTYGSALQGDFYCPALTNMEGGAFRNSNITAFRAPRLVTMGNYAMSGCTALSNVVIRGGGALGNYCINGMKCRTIIDVLGPAPTSIGTTAISANTKNAANKDNPYPQVRVARSRCLGDWETLNDVTFTPFETAKENATHKKYLGDTPEKRTKGLITGRGTFWLVDDDNAKQTIITLQ